MKKQIDQFALKELLDYDQETGTFTWKQNRGRVSKGDVAGTLDFHGYTTITINSHKYKAHRLAWMFVKGNFPSCKIDHKNGDPTDNRWENLRIATNEQNSQNTKIRKDNSLGIKGVSWNGGQKPWRVIVSKDGLRVIDDQFESVELAELVAQEARNLYHGCFARHN